jgi:hypothetical protein
MRISLKSSYFQKEEDKAGTNLWNLNKLFVFVYMYPNNPYVPPRLRPCIHPQTHTSEVRSHVKGHVNPNRFFTNINKTPQALLFLRLL